MIELIDAVRDGDNVHLILPKMDATLTDAFRIVKLSPSQISYVLREVINGLVALKRFVFTLGLDGSNGSLKDTSVVFRAEYIHVDFKSGNMLIDALGNVKLDDFGLATHPPV